MKHQLTFAGKSIAIGLPPGYLLNAGRQYTIEKDGQKLSCIEAHFTTPHGPKKSVGMCEPGMEQGCLENLAKALILHAEPNLTKRQVERLLK